MKKTIRSLLVSFPLLIAAAQSFAGYQMRIPMEVAGGGAMQNGSITFTNKAETPPETVEPSIPDPFEPENPACDPYAVGYPGNTTGKDNLFGTWYVDEPTGFEYRSCKLKPISKPKLLARFGSLIPSIRDNCKSGDMKMKSTYGSNACYLNALGFMSYHYTVSQNNNGVFNYTNQTVGVNISPLWTFTMNDIDRIEFDGVSCNNFRFYKAAGFWETNMVICDSNVSYGELVSKMDKQIMVEIYAK